MAVEGSQQNDVSELNGILTSGENTNNDSEIGNNVVGDEARAADNSKPVSPMQDGIDVSEIRNSDFRDEAEGPDISKLISPIEDEDVGFGLSKCSTTEIGALMKAQVLDSSKLITPRKDENATLSKSLDADLSSSMKDDCDDPGERNAVARDVAKDIDASKVILEGEIGASELHHNVVSCGTEGSKVTFLSEDENDASGIRTDVIGTGVEGFDVPKVLPLFEDQDNVSEIRSNIVSSKAEDDEDASKIRKNDVSSEVEGFETSKDCLLKTPRATENVPSALENGEGLKDAKKSAELRERKRSKYLSPPYVNLSKGSKGLPNVKESETGNTGVLGDAEENGGASDKPASSPSVAKTGSKKRERRSSRKSVALPGNILEISASSAELLSELHLAALDCLYPFDNKLFNPTEVFFARFRASIYNGEVDGKTTRLTCGQNEIGLVDGPIESSQLKKRKRERKTTGSGGALDNKTRNLQEGNSTGSKRGRKKKGEEKPTIGTTNAIPTGLYNKGEENPTTGPTIVIPTALYQKGEGIPTIGTTNVTPTGLYDVNVNVSETCSFTIENYSTKEKEAAQVPETSNKETAFTIDFSQETIQATPSSFDLSQETKQATVLCFNSKEAVRIPDLNGQSTAGSIPGSKKRGRPRKVTSPVNDPNSDGKHEKKKRRRKCKDGTYKDETHARDWMTNTLLSNGKNAKPISLEVCLRNVGPPRSSVPSMNHVSTPPRSTQPVNGLNNPSLPKTPGTPVEAPSIDQIKKNLEQMTAMLEKSGDHLNAEMKAKLEIEIQGLLKKVSAVPGSSSS